MARHGIVMQVPVGVDKHLCLAGSYERSDYFSVDFDVPLANAPAWLTPALVATILQPLALWLSGLERDGKPFITYSRQSIFSAAGKRKLTTRVAHDDDCVYFILVPEQLIRQDAYTSICTSPERLQFTEVGWRGVQVACFANGNSPVMASINNWYESDGVIQGGYAFRYRHYVIGNKKEVFGRIEGEFVYVP